MLIIHTPNRDLFISLLKEKVENLDKKGALNDDEKDLLERCKSALWDFEYEIEDEDYRYEQSQRDKAAMASRIAEDLSDDEYVADCTRCDFPFAASLIGFRDTVEGELMCSSCQKNYQL